MSAAHNTAYPVWSECDQHQEPDASDDENYDCIGKSSCLSHPLATWSDGAMAAGGWVYVLCKPCTTFSTEQQAWEETHETGCTLDQDTLTMCKAVPPKTYCLECSEDEGDWIQHQDDEGTAR